MATNGNPTTFATSNTNGMGYDYIFAAAQMALEIQDKLDVLSLGVVPLLGDVAGTGTDTLRVTHVGGVGWAQKMTALNSETSRSPRATYTEGYTELAVAMHGLAYDETFSSQVFNRPGGVTLDFLITQAPNNWLATFRDKLATLGAAFTEIFGTTGQPWTVDDELEHIAFYNESLGSTGTVVSVRSPQQVTQLRDSVRAESAYKFTDAFKAIQGIVDASDVGDPMGLGVRIVQTNDVKQSGGDYHGFSMRPGAVGWGRASTMNIKPKGMDRAIYMPEYGLIILPCGDDETNISGFDMKSWFGLAESSSLVVPRARIRSGV